MGNRILLPIIVCVTTLLTLWLSVDFQKRWKAAAAFHTIVKEAPLSVRSLFIAPEQLGVDKWNPGDSAVYQLKTNTDHRQIAFQVVASESQPNSAFWLKTKGLVQYNGIDMEVWRLLSTESLRPGSESAKVIFTTRAVPFLIPSRSVPLYPLILEHVGEEMVETASGIFQCQHYFAQLQAPDGSDEPLLEIWANSSVPPLGIVRARWRDEVFELVRTQTPPISEIPKMISKMIEAHQHNSFQRMKVPEQTVSVCAQCHGGEIGGKHLKQESLTGLRAVAFDLTQALYHTYAAGLAQPHNLLSLQVISKGGKRLASQSLRFTWRKGSFRVQTNPTGHLGLSLGPTAQQSNIRVATEKGHLVLNTSTKSM